FTVQMFVPRHMQLMRVKEDRIDAYSAAMMGIEYIKNEIEKNYKWEGGSGDTVKDFGEVTVTFKGSNKCITGELVNKLSGRKMSFYVSFELPSHYDSGFNKYLSYNRIGKPSTVDDNLLKNRDLHTMTDIVPKDSVLIISKGKCGQQEVYVAAGFALLGYGGCDSPLMASRQIKIKDLADNCRFVVDSADLLPSQIYSKFWDDAPYEESSVVLLNPGGTIDLNGGRIKTQGQNAYVAESGQLIEGEALENILEKGVNKEIPELKLEDVKAHLKSRPVNVNDIKAGEYVFVGENILEYRVNGVPKAVYRPDSNGVPDSGSGKLYGMKMDGLRLYINEAQKVIEEDGARDITVKGDPALTSRVKVIKQNSKIALHF
ncbi:MAG: hypothetical protein ABIH00_11905, partial [Armatimonadota bacterium]